MEERLAYCFAVGQGDPLGQLPSSVILAALSCGTSNTAPVPVIATTEE